MPQLARSAARLPYVLYCFIFDSICFQLTFLLIYNTLHILILIFFVSRKYRPTVFVRKFRSKSKHIQQITLNLIKTLKTSIYSPKHTPITNIHLHIIFLNVWVRKYCILVDNDMKSHRVFTVLVLLYTHTNSYRVGFSQNRGCWCCWDLEKKDAHSVSS